MRLLSHLVLTIVTGFCVLIAPSGNAGTYGSSGSTNLSTQAERGLVRRQEDLLRARQMIEQGDRALADDDLESAYVLYLEAVDLIGSGPAVQAERSEAIGKFSTTAIRYAEKLINDGQYLDAERVAKTVLLPQYNPTYRPAVQLLSNLEQPDYYNKTVTPAFAADREEVSRLFVEAEGFYSRGSFDLAARRYDQILMIDRYNIAARQGLERVANAQNNYYKSAYNETRSRMLWQVTEGWELPIRTREEGRTTSDDPNRTSAARSEAITAKLNSIIVPRLDLNDTTIREAVDYLRQLSRQLDTMEPDPDKRGVNIFLKLSGSSFAATPPEGEAAADLGGGFTPTEDTRVTLNLNNVPLYEALRYVSQLAGLKIKVDPVAVTIVPLTEAGDDLVVKEYRVPPTFIPKDAVPAEDAGAPFTFGGTTNDPAPPRLPGRMTAQQFLQSQGVEFPPGTSANYVATGSKLIVRNTQENIDLIDVLVDAVQGEAPTQITIEAKFVEINQNNLKELGFDWLLGPLQLGSSGVYLGGGEAGAQSNLYPFVGPNGDVIGTNPITQGLRTGQGASPNAAVSINGLDALLAGINSGPAPGIFGLSGIFTNPQFQFVIRALDQQKGIDLMSAPKVTTKSGSKAIINIVREFIYPTQFDPPQIPQSTGGGEGGEASTGSVISSAIITPTTPTAFETRNTGVTLDVTPVVGPDGYTIDLEIVPEVVDFDGFVNYGTAILGINPGTALNGFTPTPVVVTPNVINQPIFSSRKVTTNVTVWDGMTVALGGLIREDVQKVQDKVPLLGDVPLVGRLFRSDVDQKLKKNLIIFVTAQLIDAEGRPLRSDDEVEEIVEPLGLPDELLAPSLPAGKYIGGK